MAIQHVVTFTWRARTDSAVIERIADALREFVEERSGVESYSLGVDLALGAENASFAVSARFTDADAFLAYRDHPRHKQINQELVVPYLEAKTAVQFEA